MVLNHARNAAEIGDQVREKIREFAQRGLRALGVAITDDVTKPGTHTSDNEHLLYPPLHVFTAQSKPGGTLLQFCQVVPYGCGQREGVLQHLAS